VSCNTHNLCALIQSIALVDGEDNLEEARFLCIRRSNDISQVKGFVPSPEVGKHGDPVFGTHHARDAYHLFRTRGLDLNLWSSAMKLNTQYMHCIYFTLNLKRAATRDEILERFRADDKISLTKKQSAGEVFSFGRDHGYFGRLLNQTVVVESTVEVRKGHEVIGFCFTPQDGNSLVSSFSAVTWFLDPEGYKERTKCLNRYFFSEV
jgi:glyceraldehyde-3-phosphate dehydrogenase/erythrose-4-phosphate dehydrogenase